MYLLLNEARFKVWQYFKLNACVNLSFDINPAWHTSHTGGKALPVLQPQAIRQVKLVLLKHHLPVSTLTHLITRTSEEFFLGQSMTCLDPADDRYCRTECCITWCRHCTAMLIWREWGGGSVGVCVGHMCVCVGACVNM